MWMAEHYRVRLQVECCLNSLAWPPPFSIRRSTRAKYIRLKISRQRGLEIVIPQRRKQYDIATLLNKHRPWIEQKFLDWELHSPCHSLPQRIELMALSKSWCINFLEADHPLQLIANDHIIMLQGTGDYNSLLKSWLRQQAQQFLPPLLTAVSQETGLPYSKISIRLQSTRWGSCSRSKSISLNAKLMFLPYRLVKHVIIHELCHTVHHDHSKNFWDLVAHFDADHLQHRIELSRADQFVPAWIERGAS